LLSQGARSKGLSRWGKPFCVDIFRPEKRAWKTVADAFPVSSGLFTALMTEISDHQLKTR
jgi:hypothetical protein